MPDPRIQAIRCLDCHRLRGHPSKGHPNCACGSIRFVSTYPHPDEEQIALKLYAREIEQNNLYGKIAREVISDHRAVCPDETSGKKLIIP